MNEFIDNKSFEELDSKCLDGWGYNDPKITKQFIVIINKLEIILDDITIRPMVITNQFNINEKNPLFWFIERMI